MSDEKENFENSAEDGEYVEEKMRLFEMFKLKQTTDRMDKDIAGLKIALSNLNAGQEPQNNDTFLASTELSDVKSQINGLENKLNLVESNLNSLPNINEIQDNIYSEIKSECVNKQDFENGINSLECEIVQIGQKIKEYEDVIFIK